MNLENVHYLLAALEAGSFSGAADRLGLTASGINRQVSALEEELGTALLLRNRRGVLPAHGAEGVISRLRELVAADDRVKAEVAAAKGLFTGRLAIGAYFSAAASFLPPLLKDFADAHPAVTLSVTEGADAELIDGLRSGALDCAILSQHSFDGDFFPLLDTEFVAWLPPGHPLTLKDAITAKDLEAVPFVYPRAHHKSDIDDFLARHKLSPAVQLETNDPYSAYAMVAAGLGVSVNNRLQAANLKEKVVLKSFTPAERVTIGIALPSMASASPAAIRFVALAKQRRETLAQRTRGVRR